MTIWTLAFWKGAGERALKTLIAVTIGQMGVDVSGGAIPSSGIADHNWPHILSVSILATLISFGIAIGNASFTAGAAAQVALAYPVDISQAALPSTYSMTPLVVPSPQDPDQPAAGTPPPAAAESVAAPTPPAPPASA